MTAIATVAPTVTGTPWALTIGLMPADSSKISSYTAIHHEPAGQVAGTDPQAPAEYLATLADGYVVDADVIEAQIYGPVILVPVGGGKTEADALVSVLTGG